MAGQMKLDPDWKEFIELLNANDVQYLVVGGYEDFLEPDQVIQLGYPPNRIDLLTTISGVEFRDCYASRVQQVIDGVAIDFIDAENLKRNKRASGRAQDLADVENLD